MMIFQLPVGFLKFFLNSGHWICTSFMAILPVGTHRKQEGVFRTLSNI